MFRNHFQSRWWSLLVSGWLMAACTAPEDERPDKLVPTDQMADILTEVHLAEARVSRMALTSIDSSNIVYKRLENQIIKKYQLDTAVYRKSYIFYSSHPREMETIYQQVTKNLQNIISGKTPKKT
ncbi:MULTISPECIES: DUF4296 domain-containing protein [unclassified Spirosoma]|uniref:DUF4296 domain-containing protein n=1 Tax=unclassified Spirosoma TaxID=2621999 RepID=UPI000966E97E|nr:MULTISPECIES: DUF4296 domain-containing protein [unclassified Spirosoma]MBN8820486.1 DUF4296 domain-containing protein [Spirosoma sp.]OJW72681.1 MAG: hypothetical protein BGO59_16335 [Spirosoma sp. 48-14]